MLVFGGNTDWGFLNVIFQYDTIMDQWKILPTELPQKMSEFGYVISTDERFILIFDLKHSQKIWIWNLEDMTFRESVVVVPMNDNGGFWKKVHTKCVMMKCPEMDDESEEYKDLLVMGVIKEWLDESNMSMDVVRMIKEFYFDEYIHVIVRNAAREEVFHRGIKLRKVLIPSNCNSLTDSF